MSDYIKNAGWIFAEKFVRIIVGFILFALVSRVLGPADFGLLSYYQTIATMLLAITSLGFDNVLINKFQTKINHNIIFATAFWSRVIFSIIVIFIFMIGMAFESNLLRNKIVLIICLVSLIFQAQNTYFSYYQSQLKAFLITKVSLVSLTLSAALKIVLLYQKQDIIWFAISYSFDFFVSFVALILVSYKNKYVSLKFTYFKLEMLKQLLKESWPIIASSVIIVLYTRLDQLMIMRMLGAESVAVFSVAIRIAEAYVFIPAALVTSYYPLIARDPSKDNVRFYFDIVYFSSFCVGLVIAIAAYFFIPIMFGQQYVESYNVMLILLFGTTFAVFGSACTNLMIIYGLSYLRLVRAIFGLVINFALNIFLIPRFGILGAAVASLFSQIFAAWLSNCLNKKTVECFKWQTSSVLMFGIPGAVSLINMLRGKEANHK
ncbi:flippase [Enterobacter huaxiensis]|uniref:flippase n=1 Tax=Enterobacter huaxiensis TaxID=2494702 RepID=UPI0021758FC4|nr:flippase [Enterobacter huaxiensis]MCS5449773.1 flippase [Enterobacter huaxiensis]